MSSSNISSGSELCYIPCNICNSVLAVGVPSSRLFDTVTVRCEQCCNLWAVNLATLRSRSAQDSEQVTNSCLLKYQNELGSSSKCNKNKYVRKATTLNTMQERIVNPPPNKRHRAPSLYNQFIKEEIQRIKTNNPDISHREAFSTAAKNWARFPHINFGLILEKADDQAKPDEEASPD
ncbi:hypothetical protein SLE2022_316620 [Rubroshorea leprosula]